MGGSLGKILDFFYFLTNKKLFSSVPKIAIDWLMSSLESDEKASLEVLNSRDTVFLSQEICEKCHHKKGRRRSKSSDNVLKTRRGSGNIESIKLTSITSSPFAFIFKMQSCQALIFPTQQLTRRSRPTTGTGRRWRSSSATSGGRLWTFISISSSLLLSGGRTPGQSTSVTALSQPWTSIAALSTIPK